MTPFEYMAPTTLAEAIEILHNRTDVRLLAGGTDLLGEMKRGLARPACVVSLKNLTELAQIRSHADGTLQIGSLATLADIAQSPNVQRDCPLLIQAIGQTATPQIRHIGTIGGNLCQRPRCWYYRHPDYPCLRKHGEACYAMGGEDRYHAVVGGHRCFYVHPSDIAPVLVATEARVTVAGIRGERAIPAESFFLTPAQDMLREVDLASDEVLTQIAIPGSSFASRTCYLKLSERKATDFALVSVAVSLALEGEKCKRVRLVLGGVAPTPWRLTEVEEYLGGQTLTGDRIDAACEMTLREATPLRQNRYKVALAKGLLRKALRELLTG